jgi:hypothetical protein
MPPKPQYGSKPWLCDATKTTIWLKATSGLYDAAKTTM